MLTWIALNWIGLIGLVELDWSDGIFCVSGPTRRTTPPAPKYVCGCVHVRYTLLYITKRHYYYTRYFITKRHYYIQEFLLYERL